MRTSMIYLLCVSAAIGLIYLVIQQGNRLVAPAALPSFWQLRIETVSADCPLFTGQDSQLSLSQSGETLSVTFRDAWELELHGKVDRQGIFKLAGKIRNGRALGCHHGVVTWEGTAQADQLAGILAVTGEDCGICKVPLRVSGSAVK